MEYRTLDDEIRNYNGVLITQSYLVDELNVQPIPQHIDRRSFSSLQCYLDVIIIIQHHRRKQVFGRETYPSNDTNIKVFTTSETKIHLDKTEKCLSKNSHYLPHVVLIKYKKSCYNIFCSKLKRNEVKRK